MEVSNDGRFLDKLDVALASFFEDDGIPFSSKFSNLRQAIMWNALETMKKIKEYGLRSKVSEEEEYKQVEILKQFKILEKIYKDEVKANKSVGKSEEELGREWLQRVRESDNIGKIVVKQERKDE